MAAIQVSVQEMSDIYMTTLCVYAACAVLVYDWLLCLDQEVRYIWNWHSGVTLSTLVYSLCRYGMVIHNILALVEVYPMSDVSCAANLWIQVVTEILAMVAVYAFSGLRAYALSNKNIWLTAAIMLLVVPPVVIFIAQSVYEAPLNLPPPINCTSSTFLPPALSGITVTLVTRVSQFAIELLVVAITWWYSYQSYRVRKDALDFGKSMGSLLVYNGSIYFLFLASLYSLDIIFRSASVPKNVTHIANFLELFYDPIATILVCRFMLSLRQFDASTTSTTDFRTDSRVRELTESTVLQFGAQPSELLPAFIASFAHPVHIDSSLSESDPDAETIGDDRSEYREMDVAVTTLDDPPVTPCWSPAPADRSDRPPQSEYCA